MIPEIRAVLFDLDQTLVDRDATFLNFLKGQYKRFSRSLNTIEQPSYISYLKTHDNNGYTPKQQLYEDACLELGLEISPKTLLADFNENYGYDAVTLEGAHDVLKTLRHDYKLGLITNGRSKGQNAKIDSAGLRPYFLSIKISEEEGIKKPAPEIYQRCLAELELPAEACVFVGDNPQCDVMGAKQVGMKAIWVKNLNFEAPESCDGVIERMSELPYAIKRISLANGPT